MHEMGAGGMMIYDLGLTNIVAKFDEKTETHIVNNKSFITLVKAAICSIPFDQEWYLSQYEDVRKAVRDKCFETAFEHYLEHGFMECRLPYEIKVDEEFYLNAYEDVRTSVEGKTMPSAQWHFENHGRCENRMPYRDFSIFEDAGAKFAIAMPQTLSEEDLSPDREPPAAESTAALQFLPQRRRRRKRSGQTGRNEVRPASARQAQRR